MAAGSLKSFLARLKISILKHFPSVFSFVESIRVLVYVMKSRKRLLQAAPFKTTEKMAKTYRKWLLA